MRTLNQRNAELARKLDRLEQRDAAPIENLPADSAAVQPAEIPSLTVVKLKPRVDPATKMDVSLPVIEPSPQSLAQLIASAPEARDASSNSARRSANAGLADLEFDDGMMALKTGNVSGGVAKLQRFAAQYPKHPKADDALYFSGIGQMGLADYGSAANSFEQVIANYPAGNVVLDAMLRLAECRIHLNKVSEARKLYTQLVARYPGTAAATQAEQRLGSLSP